MQETPSNDSHYCDSRKKVGRAPQNGDRDAGFLSRTGCLFRDQRLDGAERTPRHHQHFLPFWRIMVRKKAARASWLEKGRGSSATRWMTSTSPVAQIQQSGMLSHKSELASGKAGFTCVASQPQFSVAYSWCLTDWQCSVAHCNSALQCIGALWSPTDWNCNTLVHVGAFVHCIGASWCPTDWQANISIAARSPGWAKC